MFRLTVVSLASWLLLSSLALAGSSQPQSKPYTPAAADQQQCLGAAKKARFAWRDITWPQKPGDADICLWKDDRYAACSLTIDDNSAPDHEWWLQQCKKHGFRVTWFIITKRLKDKPNYFGTWADFQKLQDAGHSVQSHTITHNRDDSKRSDEEIHVEYGSSKALIEKQLKGNRCLTLAYPCGKGKPDVASSYFIAARGTVGTPNPVNRINYANTCTGSVSKDQIHAVLGNPDIKTNWLKRDKYRRGWICPLFHLVAHGKTPEARAQSRQKTEEKLEYLAQQKDKIWIDTFVDVAKYGQERDSATLKTVAAKGTEIRLVLTDKMRDDLFDYPLTLKVRLMPGWRNAVATQGKAALPLRVVTHQRNRYALVQAIPDRGEIVVKQEAP